MSAPLLEAENARIAIDGAVVVDRLTLRTRGERVILAGDAGGLMAALTGAPPGDAGGAQLVGGELRLFGHDVGAGGHRAIAGAAPLDPPLWGRFTVLEYLGWHARLMGYGRMAARARASAVLELLALQEGKKRKLATLAPPARRALEIAAALLNDPRVVIIENPFADVDGEARTYLEELVLRATEGRAAIVSLSDLSHVPEAMLQQASDACVLRGGRLLAHDAPSALLGAARLFEVLVARGAEALRAELAREGLELTGGPRHFVLRLPDGRHPGELLAAAARARASVMTCMPLFGP